MMRPELGGGGDDSSEEDLDFRRQGRRRSYDSEHKSWRLNSDIGRSCHRGQQNPKFRASSIGLSNHDQFPSEQQQEDSRLRASIGLSHREKRESACNAKDELQEGERIFVVVFFSNKVGHRDGGTGQGCFLVAPTFGLNR